MVSRTLDGGDETKPEGTMRKRLEGRVKLRWPRRDSALASRPQERPPLERESAHVSSGAGNSKRRIERTNANYGLISGKPW